MSESQQSLSSIAVASRSAPSWKRSLEKAMRESDSGKLLSLVYDTEAALFVRWQQISNDETHQAEREAMNEAASDLWSIKVYKLGWPGRP